MDFTIVQIGDTTSNGNRIVKMQHAVEINTVIGTQRKQETYYMAVKADTVKVTLNESVNLNIADFKVTERPFVNPESNEEIMLKWLSIK